MKTRFLAVLLCAMILAASALAQTRRGALSGRALDAAGAVLQGARIELTPSGRSAASDGQGQFSVSDLAPGNYTVTVSYVGFTAFKKEVAVAADSLPA